MFLCLSMCTVGYMRCGWKGAEGAELVRGILGALWVVGKREPVGGGGGKHVHRVNVRS